MDLNFVSFLLLALISAVVAVAYHDIFKYRFLEDIDARFGKVILGWFGAWLGAPIFGNWLWRIEGVYIFPAILGAVAVIHLGVLLPKALAKVVQMRPVATTGVTEEVRTKLPRAA